MKTRKAKKKWPIGVILLILIGLAGATALTPELLRRFEQIVASRYTDKTQYTLTSPSRVLPLATNPPQQRREKLLAIANEKKPSLDRSRARYLLALDIIREELDGGKALPLLKNLDKEYHLLAPYIILLQGRAYELTNDTEKAIKTWEKLVSQYPHNLILAEAYYKLGKYQPEYWEKAITQFPQHPRSQQIAKQLLETNPQRKQLYLILAKYQTIPENKTIVDRLVQNFSSQLSTEDWDVIGNFYWQTGNYLAAAGAYQKASKTPENLYRIARSYQVTNRPKEAKTAYLQLVKQFPSSPYSGLAYRRLASLTTGDEALSYLNKVDQKFPEEMPAALKQKVTLLTLLKRYSDATATRDRLLKEFPNSEEAAFFRWQIAQEYANKGDYTSAWQWARQISVYNPDSIIAPKAGFWVGKWAEKLGQPQEAIKAYQHVLQNYPHSYYAWRSAVKLGKKEAGDFNNLRYLTFNLSFPSTRPILPAGSPQFKELFLLGEDATAIDLFLAEIADKKEISVSEQFVLGILKQIQGKYLEGINEILNLRNRTKPEDNEEWRLLRESPEYWYALFPFPYKDIIIKWSEERKINPLLVVALIRQESRFEKDIKSPAGALGLMQIIPTTAQWIAPQINLPKYSLTNPEDNIQMGTWYLAYTHDTFNNNSLLAIASYNAGPGNVSNWISRYSLADLDEFVENIPFPETKNYVETVFGNYWNYFRLFRTPKP